MATVSPLALVRMSSGTSSWPWLSVCRLPVKEARPVFLAGMFPTYLLANPFPKFRDLPSGFALRFKFGHGTAAGNSARKRSAVSDTDRGDREAVGVEHIPGLFDLWSAGRAGIQEKGGRLSCSFGDLHASRDRRDVKGRRATGNQQEIRGGRNGIHTGGRRAGRCR
jgi:hypothetical protein